MQKGGDMIVNLTVLPEYQLGKEIRLKKALACEKNQVMDFICKYFKSNWANEAEHAMMQEPGKCFIATENGKILGFACYDAVAKGFFGPLGVLKEERNKNIGSALLIRTLEAMREYGYAYAIIGWADEAAPFYSKAVGAEYIKNGNPENSIYSNLIFM